MDDILASIRQAVNDGPAPEADAPPAPAPVAAAPLPPVLGLDAHMHALLEPALKAWLDANLPELVDRAVNAEIARLTRQPG